MITKEGSVRFEGDSKKNWILVKIYTIGDRWKTDDMKSGIFTFWIGWDDVEPRFMGQSPGAPNHEYFSVIGLEQSLAANSNFLNAFDTYVWFKDNGTVGQLPPPGGYSYAEKIVEFTIVPNYLKKELLGTNLWKRARVVALITLSGAKWFVLMISEEAGYFWFREGIDGYLMKDTENAARACVLFNARLIRSLNEDYVRDVIIPIEDAIYDRKAVIKAEEDTEQEVWNRRAVKAL